VTTATAAMTASSGPTPVWIDTDPAVGETDRDVDDGLALLQAFHSPELALRGVSVVFGNTTLERAVPIACDIVTRFGPAGLTVAPGASGPDQVGVETAASGAMAEALRRGPLTILALGPLSNVATVLRNHPELARRIVRVVAVAGRRPGQRFTTGGHNTSGHRDFNFEQDPDAFRVVLASDVPLTLAPFEVASQVWITSRDLDRLDAASDAGRWIAAAARTWLQLWVETFGVDGFNPFDALAVAYVTTPRLVAAESLAVKIQVLPDDGTERRMQGTAVPEKPYLLVSTGSDAPARHVEYCYQALAPLKEDILRRVAGCTLARRR